MTQTDWEDALYRSFAYILLAEHHTAQSPAHNLLQASLSAQTESGLHQSSLLLLHVAMCPGAALCHPTRRNNYGSPQEQALARLVRERNVQRQDDTAICSYLWWDTPSPHVRCDRGFLVSVLVVCECQPVWLMALWHFSIIIEEAVRLAPESPFRDVCDPIDPRFMCILTQHVPYSGETLRLSGCHVTSGTSRAEQKGRASLKQHVPHTQAVLALVIPAH